MKGLEEGLIRGARGLIRGPRGVMALVDYKYDCGTSL